MNTSFCFNILIINKRKLDLEKLRQALPSSEYQYQIQTYIHANKSVVLYEVYDLILIKDNSLDEDYFELVKFLKSDIKTQHIPFVLDASEIEHIDFTFFFKKGFSEIITPKMEVSEIQSRIRKSISESSYIKFIHIQLLDFRKNIQESDIENKWMTDRYFLFERIKNNYFQIISHELRTPLNIIFIICDILPKLLNKKDEHHIYKLRTALNQINDLIEISNISELLTVKGTENFTSVSFSDLYSSLYVRYANEIQTGLIEFQDIHKCDLCVNIDFDMVYKALAFTITHLYINSSQSVKLTFNIVQTKDAKIIEIANQSDKFKPTATQFLHQVISFRTIDNRNEGLKLGVRMLKYIMDYHYGKLELANTKTSGSIYRLIFYNKN